MRFGSYCALLLSLIGISSVGLVGCAKNSTTASAAANKTMTAQACSGNVYLQKYHCSLEEIQQAALAGNADAEYALGYMYYYGIGTVHDQKTATLWIQRAASQGEPLAIQAQHMLAAGHQSKVATSANAQSSTSSSTSNSHSKPWNNSQTASAQPSKELSDPRLLADASPAVPQSWPAATQSSPAPHDQLTGSSTGYVDLMNKSPSHYTLQLMGGYDRQAIAAFIDKHHIRANSMVYESTFHGKPWYMLLYGDYMSASTARAAVNNLAPSLKQLKPWVKSFGLVQEEIKQHQVA